MTKILEILTSNKAKTFYWTALNGFISLFAVGMAELDWYCVPIVIALLNGSTKYINKTYL